MACFLVPTATALVAHAVKHKVASDAPKSDAKVSWRTKFSWLLTLLWGGALLLALEHIWHGEVIFAPPFLTATATADGTISMLQEMGTVGVGMAVVVLAIWAVMVVVVDRVAVVRKAVTAKAD